MANLTITQISLIEAFEEPRTVPAAEAVDPGEYVRQDANGKAELGSAVVGGADVGVIPALALNSAIGANRPVDLLRRGLVDVGSALDGLAVEAAVYLSDTPGKLADTAGTVSTVVGRVVAFYDGETMKKCLRFWPE